MSEERAEVRNAADPEQVAKASKKLESERDKELNDIRILASMPEGKRFFARILAQFKVSNLQWLPDPGAMSNAVGWHEAANWILGEITLADSQIGAELLIDAYEKAKRKM
jgi:hypothetical protein